MISFMYNHIIALCSITIIPIIILVICIWVKAQYRSAIIYVKFKPFQG